MLRFKTHNEKYLCFKKIAKFKKKLVKFRNFFYTRKNLIVRFKMQYDVANDIIIQCELLFHFSTSVGFFGVSKTKNCNFGLRLAITQKLC